MGEHTKLCGKPRPQIYIIGIIALFFVLGIIAGAINATSLPSDKAGMLYSYLHDFFGGATAFIQGSSDVFFECVLKYGKLIIGIWALSLITPGLFAALFLLFFRGMATGFTTAFLVSAFGSAGLYNAVLLCLLQNLILIPACFYVLYSGFAYNIEKTKAKPTKFRKKSFIPLGFFRGIKLVGFPEYVLVLVIGVACAVMAGIVETFVVPSIAGFIR